LASKEIEINLLVDPIVKSMGFVFWGLSYVSQGRHSTLRIFIDHENGIDVDDCAKVSRQISSVLDVEDPITQEYTLEVSSPGMDRPLFTLAQYQDSVGQWIELKLRIPFEGRRNFKGPLAAVENDEIVIQVDQHEYLLPFEIVEKANIVPQFKD
jgi:ribosome maturation factor RimP